MTHLGYNSALGYDLDDYDPAELEKTFLEVVSERDYDPTERRKVVFAGFALPAGPDPAP